VVRQHLVVERERGLERGVVGDGADLDAQRSASANAARLWPLS
jgi:hypothetical protein